MTIELKVKEIIADILAVDVSLITDQLGIGDLEQWDSVNNVRILQALESCFAIEIDVLDALDAEDVMDFTAIVKRNVEG